MSYCEELQFLSFDVFLGRHCTILEFFNVAPLSNTKNYLFTMSPRELVEEVILVDNASEHDLAVLCHSKFVKGAYM